MSIALTRTPLISPEEFLAAEETSEIKHEYLNGMVYAVAGATQRHNDIAGNIFGTLHGRLRGRPCRPYSSDMLVEINISDDQRFYYPDVSVICRLARPGA